MSITVGSVINHPRLAAKSPSLLRESQPVAMPNSLFDLKKETSTFNSSTDRVQRDWLVEKLFNLENQPRQDLILVKLIIRAAIVPLEKIYRLIEGGQSGNARLLKLIESYSLLSCECSEKLQAVLRKVEDGTVTFDCAIEATYHIYWDGQSVESALNLVWAPTWKVGSSVIDFLLVAGIIDQSDIDLMVHAEPVPPSSLAQLLVSAGILDECTLQIATRVRFLLNQGKITMEQALSIVQFCLKYNVDVDSIIASRWPND